MITGFNTDIERDGVVYHVQTEDKGLDSPLILSLVYSGGEILAAKRTPYQDLITEGFTDEALAERLKRQHRLICAAINAGRIEELKKMSSKRDEGTRAKSGPPVKIEQPSVEPTLAQQQPVEVHQEFVTETSSTRPPATEWKPTVENVIAEPLMPSPEATQPTPSGSPDAAYTVYDSRRPSRSKQNKKREEKLALSILDDEEFRAGQTVTIRMVLQRHVDEVKKPLGGVQLSIKVLGSTFRPQIYTVKTQRDGVAVMSIDLPRFSSGRAAVVIRAEAQGESVELRRVIHPVEV